MWNVFLYHRPQCVDCGPIQISKPTVPDVSQLQAGLPEPRRCLPKFPLSLNTPLSSSVAHSPETDLSPQEQQVPPSETADMHVRTVGL